jgi:transcriptional regulator with XRE-family HTH domain
MAKTTFGEELRKKRKAQKWNQQKLTVKFYEAEDVSSTTIGRWERGENDPEAENVERLVEIFNLSYPDAMFWYGLAGKLPRLRMPSRRQIIESLETMTNALQEHIYPAYVLDNRHFRFWLINPGTVKLVGGIERAYELAKCSVFQLAFSRHFGIMDTLGDDLPKIQREQIRRFKALNIYRRHENFYMEYPERLKLKDGLTESEYEVFEKLWNEVEPDEMLLSDYAKLGDMTFNLHEPVKFRLIAETILHLGNLFSVSWYNIVDKEHEAAAATIFRRANEEECIKVWELPEVNTSELFD